MKIEISELEIESNNPVGLAELVRHRAKMAMETGLESQLRDLAEQCAKELRVKITLQLWRSESRHFSLVYDGRPQQAVT